MNKYKYRVRYIPQWNAYVAEFKRWWFPLWNDVFKHSTYEFKEAAINAVNSYKRNVARVEDYKGEEDLYL